MPTKREETKTKDSIKEVKEEAKDLSSSDKVAKKIDAVSNKEDNTSKKTTAKKTNKAASKDSIENHSKSNSAKAKASKEKKPDALYYGTGRRKNAVARVRLYAGSGNVSINGRDIKEYFPRDVLVNDAVSPLVVTETNTHFDVVANIKGGGNSGQAGALRHGISRALLHAGDYHDILKKYGYLTRDSRMVERKKYGLKKARKKSQFSKR